MQTITNFNATQGFVSKDSTFKIEGNPYYYYGIVADRNHGVLYHLGLHTTSNPPALLLISVENIQSGEIFGINHEPANKEEIMRRKAAIKNFEERVLDKLGLTYVHKGNAMNKEY